MPLKRSPYLQLVGSLLASAHAHPRQVRQPCFIARAGVRRWNLLIPNVHTKGQTSASCRLPSPLESSNLNVSLGFLRGSFGSSIAFAKRVRQIAHTPPSWGGIRQPHHQQHTCEAGGALAEDSACWKDCTCNNKSTLRVLLNWSLRQTFALSRPELMTNWLRTRNAQARGFCS